MNASKQLDHCQSRSFIAALFYLWVQFKPVIVAHSPEAVNCLPFSLSSVPAPPSVVDSFVAWQASYSGRLSISGASSTGAGWFRGCFTPGTIRLDVNSNFLTPLRFVYVFGRLFVCVCCLFFLLFLF